MPGTLYRFLAEDHARLDGLLQGSMTETGTINRAAYAEFRVGLLTHISMEERILLPAVQRMRGGEPLAKAAKLRLDHGALAALLVPTPTPAIIAALRAILGAHNMIEEGPGGCTSAVSSWRVPRLRRCWPSCMRPRRCRWPRTAMVPRSWTSCAGRLSARATMMPCWMNGARIDCAQETRQPVRTTRMRLRRIHATCEAVSAARSLLTSIKMRYGDHG